MNTYIENPQMDVFPEFDQVYNRFKQHGILKPKDQMRMYRTIANYWCTGKSVLDVGCGIGIGTNILGQDALGAWGVDNAEESIRVAKQLYEGPRTKFDVYNIVNPPDRPVATFDVVTMIEVIEHIKDYDVAFENLKRFYEDKRRTVFFISSPNRNHPRLSDLQPKNAYHVREWTAGEFYEVLVKHFGSVVLFAGGAINSFSQEETVDGNTEQSPILAKCEFPR